MIAYKYRMLSTSNTTSDCLSGLVDLHETSVTHGVTEVGGGNSDVNFS